LQESKENSGMPPQRFGWGGGGGGDSGGKDGSGKGKGLVRGEAAREKLAEEWGVSRGKFDKRSVGLSKKGLKRRKSNLERTTRETLPSVIAWLEEGERKGVSDLEQKPGINFGAKILCGLFAGKPTQKHRGKKKIGRGGTEETFMTSSEIIF